MTAELRARIIAKLVAGTDLDHETARLCEVCAEVTGMTGAGIMLMSGDVAQGSVCTTDDVSALLEQLQFDLGEGPCTDAYHEDQPVLEPDLVEPRQRRWQAFRGPAIEAGVRAVFGFPLRVGVVRLGALNLYNIRSGSLTDDQHRAALVVADIAAQTVLAMQAAAPPGRLALELEADGSFPSVVHQASGMVAAQLGIGVGQALIRLRGHAFGNGRSVAHVAGDVVARRIRFDPRTGELHPDT